MTVSFKAKKDTPKYLFRIYKVLFKAFGPQHWWPGDTPFEIMIGAILTQNTNWHNVTKAIDNIKKRGALSPKKLLGIKNTIPKLIRPSGCYNIKSKRLITYIEYLVHHYDGGIAKMKKKRINILRDELLNLPGIGHETADSILLYALSRPVFVIDAYTRRIFSRHGFFEHNLAYDKIRSIFENNLPRDAKLYNEYHALIVKCGKEFCRKNEPLCNTCPLRDTTSIS